MLKPFARHGYVHMCYLNWVYTVNDWKYRIRAERGRRWLIRAAWRCIQVDTDAQNLNRIEACEILWNKFEELGGRR